MNSISDSWLICFAEEFGLNHRGTESKIGEMEPRIARICADEIKEVVLRELCGLGVEDGARGLGVWRGFGEMVVDGNGFNILLLLGALDRLFALG